MEEKEILQTILSEITGIKSEIKGLKSDVNDLKSDVNSLKSDVTGLKSDVNDLKSDVTGLKSDVNSLKSEVKELSVRQQHTDDAVQQLRTDMNRRFDTLEADMGKVLVSITDETSAIIKQKERKLELLKK